MNRITGQMGALEDKRPQSHHALPWVVFTLVVLFVSGVILLLVHYGTGVDIELLTVDPAAEVGLAPYVGVVSYLGILFLWSAASVGGVGYIVLKRSREYHDISNMVGAFSLLLAWLAIDDLFLIHEEIGLALAKSLDRLNDRSLLETPVFLVYGLSLIMWLAGFRKTILQRSTYLLLVLGLGALGLSVGTDLGEFAVPGVADATPWMATTLNMFEEFAKLSGMILLTGYMVTTIVPLLCAAPDETGPQDDAYYAPTNTTG
jgi:hypothetical protein